MVLSSEQIKTLEHLSKFFSELKYVDSDSDFYEYLGFKMIELAEINQQINISSLEQCLEKIWSEL